MQSKLHILDMQSKHHILDMQKFAHIVGMQTLKTQTRHTNIYYTYSTCKLLKPIYTRQTYKVLRLKHFGNLFKTQTRQQIGINHLEVLLSIQVHDFKHSTTPIDPFDHKHIRVSHKNHKVHSVEPFIMSNTRFEHPN